MRDKTPCLICLPNYQVAFGPSSHRACADGFVRYWTASRYGHADARSLWLSFRGHLGRFGFVRPHGTTLKLMVWQRAATAIAQTETRADVHSINKHAWYFARYIASHCHQYLPRRSSMSACFNDCQLRRDHFNKIDLFPPVAQVGTSRFPLGPSKCLMMPSIS